MNNINSNENLEKQKKLELKDNKNEDINKETINSKKEKDNLEKEVDKNTTKKDRKKFIKNIIILQVIILIYTLSTVTAKFASNEEFLSFKFILFYGLEILILGVYAILWQQIIKKFEISVAYANRAMSLLWSIVWAIVFFGEQITLKNVIGVIIVIIGTIIVNSDE